jgi:Tfp pilus assembly protein PilO
MVKKDNSEYNFAILLGAGALVVGLILIFAIIKPLYDKNSEMRQEKTKREAELTRLQNREKVLLSLKDRAADIREDSERVSRALPTSSDIGRLFIQLDELAKVSGGNLKSVSESNSTTTGALVSPGVTATEYSLPMEMPSYFALKKFFESSEEALRLLSIDNIRIDANEAGAMSVNISAKAYKRSK